MVPGPQRARGDALIAVHTRGAISALADLRMSGSAKLLFPRPSGPALQAVYLNTAGGITGGDRYGLTANVAPDASLTLTTQAAERIYRSAGGDPGHVRSALTVEEGGTLHWLPQETLLYDGAALDRTLTVTLGAGARLLACETLVFGRAAMGETVRRLSLRDRVSVCRDGRLIFADRLRIEGDAQATLARHGVADGHTVLASVLWAAPGAASRLDALRAALPPLAGASALDDDLVFLRILAPDSFALRRVLMPVLAGLSDAPLPRPWTM